MRPSLKRGGRILLTSLARTRAAPRPERVVTSCWHRLDDVQSGRHRPVAATKPTRTTSPTFFGTFVGGSSSPTSASSQITVTSPRIGVRRA